jgi:mono/diheme cytochrome c family protein
MKLFVRIIGGLLVLVVIAVSAVFALSQREFTQKHDYSVGAIGLPNDSASLARGRHLATALGKCVECHGDDLGGRVFMDNGAMGTFVAPNLTGGSAIQRTAADIERALRHGVGTDGRALAFMPSQAYAHLSTADMAALIAYVQSLPAVTRDLPARKVGPIARMIVATNQARLPVEEIDHAATPPSTVPEAVSVEYGKYLADIGGCTGCHSPNLAGGKQEGPPGTPPAANLTPGGRDWTLPDFTRALREGIRPGGTPIDSFMPWKMTRLMTDAEIEAVWMYVRSVPPRAFGEE